MLWDPFFCVWYWGSADRSHHEWHFMHSQCYPVNHYSSHRHFNIPKGNSLAHKQLLLISVPHPLSLGPGSHPVSMGLPIPDMSYEWSHVTWSFMPGLSHFAQRSQGPSAQWQVSISRSVVWQNNIPLYGCTTFGLSIHRSVGIWIISSFCLLWIVLLWIFIQKFLFEHLFSIFLGIMVTF